MKRYSTHSTKLQLWYCQEYESDYKCKESWLWSKSYKKSYKSLSVSQQECSENGKGHIHFENLQKLTEIHESGEGNILSGIGQTISAVNKEDVKDSGYLLSKMGDTISSLFEHVADGSAKVMKSTAGGAATIINSTGDALESVETGFLEGVEKIFGGIIVQLSYFSYWYIYGSEEGKSWILT